MKVSVSLPGEDVRFLDEYVKQQRLESRSAALHRAVRLLRTMELAAPYEAAWDDWATSGDEDVWAVASDDGLAT